MVSYKEHEAIYTVAYLPKDKTNILPHEVPIDGTPIERYKNFIFEAIMTAVRDAMKEPHDLDSRVNHATAIEWLLGDYEKKDKLPFRRACEMLFSNADEICALAKNAMNGKKPQALTYIYRKRKMHEATRGYLSQDYQVKS